MTVLPTFSNEEHDKLVETLRHTMSCMCDSDSGKPIYRKLYDLLTIVYTCKNDEYGVAVEVRRFKTKYHVMLRDTDADQIIPYIKVWDDFAAAMQYADRLAAQGQPMIPASDHHDMKELQAFIF